MASLTPTPKFQFINSNGDPLFLGKLYSYAAGTDTPLATYTSSTGMTANANPVILDAYGSANVWLGTSLYKLVLKDANDSTIYTVDNVGGNPTFSDLASVLSTSGSALIGFKQIGTGSINNTVYQKLTDNVTVWDKIPVAERANIEAYSSIYDCSNDLNNISNVQYLEIPEGGFRTNVAIDIVRGMGGRAAKTCIIRPLTNSISAIKLADTTADFQEIHDLTVSFDALGTGKGVELVNFNNNVEVNRVNVQRAATGFSSTNVAFMQRYQQCRADFCDTGFFAEGRTSGGAGAGTTMVYDQCYVSNGNGNGTGWSLSNIRSVELNQPTTDMGGLATAIVAVGVGQLNIDGHHFEGTPGGNGQYIQYNTSGNLSAGINVKGGCLEIADLSALTYSYLNVNANDDIVRITLENVNVRNVTGGPNARLATLAGQAGSHIEIIAINCDFGPLEGVFNTTNLLGTYNYRRIDRELDSSTRCFALYDDFLGITLNADWWRTRVGTDPQCVAAAVLADQRGGQIRMTGGDDAAQTMAVNGTQLDSALNWRAQDGLLSAEFNVSLQSTATNTCVFIGLTDQVSTLEMPFTLAAGNVLTSNATDAVGVLFDTAADTDQWAFVGVKANVDATTQFSGFAPVSGTFESWRIDVSQQGNATFYRNGVAVGSTMSNAVTASVLLTPVIAQFTRGTGITRGVVADFIKCQQIR